MENKIAKIKANHKGFRAELITKIAFFIANNEWFTGINDLGYDMATAYSVAKEYVN